MDSKTKVFRAHRALAWLYGAIGLGFVALAVIGGGSALVLMPLLVALALITAAHYFTARACLAGKSSGRNASILISCLMLLGFPVGTLIGAYLLTNTWKPWQPTTSAT